MRLVDPVSSSQRPVARTTPSVLVFAYAFPPIHVQISPVVARLVTGLNELGFAVDVICAHPDVWPLPRDDSLLEYVNARCRRVQRLPPPPRPGLLRRFANHEPRVNDFPDCMGQLHKSAFAAVMAAEPWTYAAVLTVSPFYSVNPVMVRVRRARPDVRWIAHFCDPWAKNPLEHRWEIRLWGSWREPQTLRAATYVTHSSPHALEMVLKAYPFLERERTRVVPHVYDQTLYPFRPKRRNDKVILRFIGTLFGRRTPEPVFLALARLLERRPNLRDVLRLELVGKVEPEMLEGTAAVLPAGMVRHRPHLSYSESLELMYDADVLLVIEADATATPFVPSKVTDYMGANTPIVGIAPPGGCRELLDRIGCPVVAPKDISGIVAALETAIERVVRRTGEPWCDEDARRSFDLTSGAALFASLIMEAAPK